MINCQNCGSPNPEVARICRYCGAHLQPGGRAQAPYAPPQSDYVPPWAADAPPAPVQPLTPTAHEAGPQPFVAGHFRCPHCGSTELPVVSRRISTAGWIVFFALLVFCFPLCFVGLFIKEEYRMCNWCRGAIV